ncbi:MAG: redox-regulated ATPase YchF [Candidatus Tectomicrobia bacterium]|nr:redox-regulated ATPase YchF [Candidatus Tectomicrobia bacterium]
MKLGIIGLSKSGKTTIFNALTHGSAETTSYVSGKVEPNIGVVKVPDSRLDTLSHMFHPKKTTPADVEYIDIVGFTKETSKGEKVRSQLLTAVRNSDALAHVIRFFHDDNVPHPEASIDPERDARLVETELILTDLEVVEKRRGYLESSKKKGRKEDEAEYLLLTRCQEALEREVPLRDLDLSPEEKLVLKGFQFLTDKPLLQILNLGEDQLHDEETQKVISAFKAQDQPGKVASVAICGKLEGELAELHPEDAQLFMEDLGIDESALGRLITASYDLVRLITFFTVGENEVKAWPIPQGTTALKGAGEIHSDLEKGFIRAEVIHYDDLISCGSMAAARSKGLLRLEGKEYLIRDGDVITIRFNV